MSKYRYQKYEKTKDLSLIVEEYRKKWVDSDLDNKRKLKQSFFSINAPESLLNQSWNMIVNNIKPNKIMFVEIWKKTVENNKYEVSNLGRFRRINKNTTAKYTTVRAFNHNKRSHKTSKKKNVLFVRLGSKEYLAKKVVANAFVDNPNKYTCVMQIDGNYKNIDPDNLKWVSQSYIGKITGHLSKSIKVEYYDKKTKETKIYRSVRMCARCLGVSYQTILDYCNKKVKNPLFKVKYFKEQKKVIKSE